MRIGVLALQGAFIEHKKMIEALGEECFEIRQLQDIEESFDALILPGGESTVQSKLLRDLGLLKPLKDLIKNGLPVMGTCAGLILLSESIEHEDINGFKTLPVTTVRNAYGRQLGSFSTTATFAKTISFPMIFIRAPYIKTCEKGVNILAKVDDKIVAVEYKNQIAMTFHPELTDNKSIHTYFLSKIKA